MKRHRGSLSATIGTDGSSARHEPTPAVVGRFLIEEVIGRGGMSDVYRAFDPELNRHVALKVLAPTLGRNPEFTKRFIRESRAAAQLNHPHVVPIFEAGSDGDTLFIAMQLVRGADLKSHIQERGQLPLDDILSILGQVSEALDHAHQNGLLHRDVKPANLMLERHDNGLHVYLTDFGLTRSLGTDSRITSTGELVGSVHYVSPEHLEGRELDTRSDIYSLGCVLYECLTGHPPFERDTDMAVLWAHLNAEVPRPSRSRRALPHVVDRVVARAMAKDPETRFSTCSELSESLGAALQGIALNLPIAVKKERVSIGSRARSLSGVAVAVLLLGSSIAVATRDWSGSGAYRPSESVSDASDASKVVGAPKSSSEANPRTRSASRHLRGEKDLTTKSTVIGRARTAGVSPSDQSDGSPTLNELGGDGLTATRTLHERYDVTSSELRGLNDTCDPDSTQVTSCVQFILGSRERFANVVLTDEGGVPVGAYIKQDWDQDGNWDGDFIGVCDFTDESVELVPGSLVQIVIDSRPCGGDSQATVGTVAVRLFRGAS